MDTTVTTRVKSLSRHHRLCQRLYLILILLFLLVVAGVLPPVTSVQAAGLNIVGRVSNDCIIWTYNRKGEQRDVRFSELGNPKKVELNDTVIATADREVIYTHLGPWPTCGLKPNTTYMLEVRECNIPTVWTLFKRKCKGWENAVVSTGKNLVTNGDFEGSNPPEGWRSWQMVDDSKQYVFGTQAGQICDIYTCPINFPYPGKRLVKVAPAREQYRAIKQLILVKPNFTYLFTFYDGHSALSDITMVSLHDAQTEESIDIRPWESKLYPFGFPGGRTVRIFNTGSKTSYLILTVGTVAHDKKSALWVDNVWISEIVQPKLRGDGILPPETLNGLRSAIDGR